MRLLLVTDEEQGVDEFILELQECGVLCESMKLKHDLITVDGGAELSEAFVKQLQQRMGGEEDVDALLLCEQQCYHGLDLPLLRRLCFLPILVLEKHPTAYDERLLTYWEMYPEKMPNVIIVDCWYGQLMTDPQGWMMQYIENDFGYKEIHDGRYIRIYRK